MKLIKLINANNVLSNFVDESIDVQLAYKLMKFVTSNEKEAEFMKNKLQKLVDKYSTTDENGDKTILQEKIDDFNREVSELQNTEVDAPAIKFTIAELAPLKMTMRQMFALSDFIEESK